VALRSLAFMVGDKLTTNLAEVNRGDIRVYASRGVPELVQLSEQGDPVFTAETVQVVRDWARHEDVDITIGRMTFFGQFTPVKDGEAETSQLGQVLFVEPELYPFHGEITLTDPPGDLTLEEFYAQYQGEPENPYPIVISSHLARQVGLHLQMGDTFRIGAGETLYIVSGIVPATSETVLTNPAAALLGDYAYLPMSALALMDEPVLPDQLYIKVPLGRDIEDAEKSLIRQLQNHYDPEKTDFDKELNRATVPELEKQNRATADVIDNMILVMGLSSLLIGGIGIINTMLVVVSRRTLEVAVLKTLGLKAYRVTLLFLVEALLMGLIGSLIGVVFGVILSYMIRSVGEEAFAITLQWRIYPEAMLSGVFLGVVITCLFGFLPTLIAGQVRPAVVLRPNEAQMPAAGLLQVLFALVVMITILGLLVSSVAGSAIRFNPVYAIAGAGALVGLFAGVIVANTRLGQPIPAYYLFRLPRRFEMLENRLTGTAGLLPGLRRRFPDRHERGRVNITLGLRALRQGVLFYGAVAVGSAVASLIVLVVSEVWLPFGLGDTQPSNTVIGALDRNEWGWAIFGLLLIAGFSLLIRRRGQVFGGLIGLSSLGITFGGTLAFLIGLVLSVLLKNTGVWGLLEQVSTGILLVEGALAVLGLVFVLYWLMVWAVGKMPVALLIGIVSLVVLGIILGIAAAAAFVGDIVLIALVVAVVVMVLGLRLRFGSRPFRGFWQYWWRGSAVDGRLVLREMSGRRSRVASTLLGLSVGVAGLSLVALTTGAASHLLEIQLGDSAEGNLLIADPTSKNGDKITEVLSQAEGVLSFSQVTTYRAVLMEINGKPVEAFHRREESEQDRPNENSNFEPQEQGVSIGLTARQTLDDMPDYQMKSGRMMNADDAGKHVIMIRESFVTEELGIEPDDRLMFLFENRPGEADDVLMQFRVIGIISRKSEQLGLEEMVNLSILPPKVLPGTVGPEGIATIAMVDESSDVYMDQVLVSLADVPGVIAIELSAVTQIIENLIGQLKAIPTLVAWLALVAGTAIIANTVALATQERRRQIGVMKAVGLKGRRVLGMLIMENGLIGLIAGLIGAAVGFLVTIIMVLATPSPAQLRDTIEFATIGWLILMSVLVAIGAATLSAWSAAAEKPMNVLRYE
ncbi:MAG: FtsX-like permease family protein, partial [Chloroflexi bacterium]|nr:FtsX-like permease family protein [Chloroflexota bacterium]